ncbi:unnamed protein product [Heterobilharzia americana]|nr:unnamed protein product [Heterobilharzia americana]
MATILDKFSSPLEKAEIAIKDDCRENLLALVRHRECLLSGESVTEECYVNPQVRENLLHFAVHQSASRCVNLLINPPFCWNSERPNSLGHSPLQLAMRRHYFPVVYSLASHSRLSYSYDKNAFSVDLLLIEPSSIELISEVLNHSYDSPDKVSNLAWLFDACEFDEGNRRCTAENIILLFELLLSGPSCPLTHSLWSAIKQVSMTNFHDISCMSYPDCLFSRNIHIRSTTWRMLVTTWASHRLLMLDLSSTCNHQPVFAFGPLSLLDLCRIAIRKHISLLIDGRRENQKKSSTVNNYNYAYLISQLPIPSKLRAFLSYCDLWPNVNRSAVKPVKKTRRFHSTGIPEYIIEDIFGVDTCM